MSYESDSIQNFHADSTIFAVRVFVGFYDKNYD